MRLLLSACALTMLSACSQHTTSPQANITAPEFDEARFRQDIQTLSSDKFEGRAPTTQGEVLTLDYLSKAFSAAGLKGANEGNFLQAVPMVSYTASEQQQVNLGGIALTFPKDIVLGSQSVSTTRL